MKRAVERQMTQPAAARLAALPVDRFTVVSVYSASELGADGPDHLEVDVRALEFAAPMNPPETERPPLDRLDQLDAALEAVESHIGPMRPVGPIRAREITPEQERILRPPRAGRRHRRGPGPAIRPLLGRPPRPAGGPGAGRLRAEGPVPGGQGGALRLFTNDPKAHPASSVLSAESMEEALRDLAAGAEPEAGDADLTDLERRVALLRLMAAAPADDQPTYLWLRGYPPGSPCDSTQRFAEWYAEHWGDGLGVEVDWVRAPAGLLPSDRLLVVKGIHARPLATTEAGTHLFCPTPRERRPGAGGGDRPLAVHPGRPVRLRPVLRTYVRAAARSTCGRGWSPRRPRSARPADVHAGGAAVGPASRAGPAGRRGGEVTGLRQAPGAAGPVPVGSRHLP